MSHPSATALARDLVTVLVSSGVSEIVVCPGSRNAPLSYAVHAAARAGLLRLHTHIDERSAGFLALGLAKAGAPAAVLVTSGTAVANLHPAVLEAAHAGVALVVLSADRPATLRGTGASQTTDQVRMFGDAADFLDVVGPDQVPDVAEALDDLPWRQRPVHLNVQLTPPLVPTDDWQPRVEHRDVRFTRKRPMPHQEVLPLGPATVVVAGDDAGPRARVLAEAAGWPLLAEPSSGARTGDHAIRTYRLLLGTGLGERIERVVVTGHPTLSRPVTRLLERADVEVVSVAPPGRWPARPFRVDRTVDALAVDGREDGTWLTEWRTADAALARAVDARLAAEPDLTPWEVAAAVARALPPQGLLLVGASSPIRDLDLMAAPWPVGQRRLVLANRGLAGIDGTVSTAIGAALGRQSSRAFALLGDVTFLHDTTGLVRGPGQPEPDLTLVVVNDDGGSIFTVLEQGAPELAGPYEDLFGTPHGVDLAALCAATRTPHWRVESLPELEQALASPNGGIEVVEVRVRRDNRRELDAVLRALA